MNHHCWRNSGSGLNDDDERTWPKLPEFTLKKRQNSNIVSQPPILSIQNDVAGNSSTNDSQEIHDANEYPKLGEIVLRRKSIFVDDDRSNDRQDFSDSDSKRFRKLKSTDSIQVDLRQTLENHRWPLVLQTQQPIKITVDICKLNVNMSVGGPLENRLKWLIMYDRMTRSEGRSGIACKTQNNRLTVPSMNFERLNDQFELVNRMSTLTCLNTDYRNNNEIVITEDTATVYPDLHEKMESLCLEKMSDRAFDEEQYDCVGQAEPIDCAAMDAALSLRICDETGESTNDIVVKDEPGRINYSRKFREYCTNLLTSNLKKHLQELLAEISRLQKKMYDRDNVKGRSKRRYYAGIKEVQKQIDLKKIKFVIIAPDLEKVTIEGGLDDTIGKLIGTCKRYEVPYCFGLDRRKLGYYVHGKGFASCIGITNYSGAEEKLKNVLCEVVEARNEFVRLVGNESKMIDVDKLLTQNELILSEIINAYLKILASNS